MQVILLNKQDIDNLYYPNKEFKLYPIQIDENKYVLPIEVLDVKEFLYLKDDLSKLEKVELVVDYNSETKITKYIIS